jgi:hypothetical protein
MYANAGRLKVTLLEAGLWIQYKKAPTLTPRFLKLPTPIPRFLKL